MASGLATLGGFYARRARRATGSAAAPRSPPACVLTGARRAARVHRVRALFVPGWFCAVGAYACLQAVVLAYLAELFPTELRATLTAFVVAARSSAGSVGLALVAGARRASTARSAADGRARRVLLSRASLLLRRLPETAGARRHVAPSR